jgi:DNA-binding IclR family transcriptional regulator
MIEKIGLVNSPLVDARDAPASYLTDQSNPTSRVIDVINFLAAHPGEDFSLAEVARQLGLSKGSAHRLLTTMADADFLARNEKKKTYSLGMALIAVGQAALEKYHGLELARREMARLTLELNVQCSATALIDHDLLILAKEGLPQSHVSLNRVGERRPLVPPMGICHVAWGSGNTVKDYLTLAAQHMSAAGYSWLEASLKLIRSRGYAMGANGPHWRELRQVTVLPVGRPREASYWPAIFDLIHRLTRNEIQLADLNEVDSHGVAQITVPIFASDGSVSLQLVLSGFLPNASTKKMERCIERMLATASLVTSQLHGRVPLIPN